MSKEIPLTQGYVAIVDDEDYKDLMRVKWYATAMKGGIKAVRKPPRGCGKRGSSIYMHREIMDAAPGEYVDHRNHDTLDNRRDNLRICTHGQNQANRHKAKGKTSQFKGVYRRAREQRWHAKITCNHKQRDLGYFDDERDAARAYNRAAREHFGEFALLNDV